MKATVVNRKNFIKELEWVNRFVDKRSAIPILNNLLISNKGDHLELTCTDLETTGIGKIETVQKGTEFAATVPVRKLVQYLKLVDETGARPRGYSKGNPSYNEGLPRRSKLRLEAHNTSRPFTTGRSGLTGRESFRSGALHGSPRRETYREGG